MACLHHRCILRSRRIHALGGPDSLPTSSSHSPQRLRAIRRERPPEQPQHCSALQHTLKRSERSGEMNAVNQMPTTHDVQLVVRHVVCNTYKERLLPITSVGTSRNHDSSSTCDNTHDTENSGRSPESRLNQQPCARSACRVQRSSPEASSSTSCSTSHNAQHTGTCTSGSPTTAQSPAAPATPDVIIVTFSPCLCVDSATCCRDHAQKPFAGLLGCPLSAAHMYLIG